MNHPSPRLWVCLTTLFACAILPRIPFFFPAVINWDESTFILMAQSILDGHLPYEQLWDNKPPLVFYWFAAMLRGLGPSVAAVRFGGALAVAAASGLTFAAASRLAGRRAGLFAGLLMVFHASAMPSGQSVMTEHLALPPLLAA